MTLEQLVNHLRKNILYDRSDRSSGDSDLLWDDDTLTLYIDEAQRKLAREGLVIRDGSTADYTQITLVAGQKDYVMHSCVFGVVSGRYDTDERDLKRTGHHFLSGYSIPGTDYFDANMVTALTPGRPLAFATDEETRATEEGSVGVVVVRVYPTPTAAEAGKKIYFRVVRMPACRLSWKRKKERPEVPEEHHLEMLSWAAHLCLNVQDQDAGNRSAANDFEDRFDRVVKKARSHAMRKMFAPQGWGFGRSGWAWES